MLILLRQGRLSKWFSGHRPGGHRRRRRRRAPGPTMRSCRCTGTWACSPARGLDLLTLFRQLLGRDGGFTRGRDRTFHFGAPAHHIVGMISHLGAMLPVADGLALAYQLRGESRVAAAFTGEGATSEGDFHEAVNLAAVWKLPVVFVVENNQYGAVDAGVASSTPARSCPIAASGYGMAGETVDGNDVTGRRRGRGARGRAGARRRGADAPRVRDVPHARARGSVGRRLRAAAPVRGVGGEGSDRCASSSGCSPRARSRGRRPRRIRAEFKALIDRVADEAFESPEPDSTAGARAGGRRTRPPATSRRPTLRRSRAARPSAGAKAAERSARSEGRRTRAPLHRRHLRRPPRSDASARPSVVLLGPGHRRVRRRLQGDRRHASSSSARRACATRPSSSPAPSARRWDWRSKASGRWSRCSSATSSRAASTRSSTTSPRRTTAGASGCRRHSRAGRRRHGRRAVPLAEPGGLVHARGGPEGRGAGDARATPRACCSRPFEDGNPVLYLEHKFLYRSTKGAGSGRLLHRADRPGARGARGLGRDDRHVGRRRRLGARRRRDAWRERRLGRSDRPADAAAVGSRSRARVGQQDQPRARAARSAAHRRLRRRSAAAASGRMPSRGSTRR